MKALTVRQPWAWAILHGKSPENRTHNIAGGYRGPLAIHASLTRDPSAWEHPALRDLFQRYLDVAFDDLAERMRSAIAELDVGVVIGVVDLVDVHPCADGCCPTWGEHEYVETQRLCDDELTVVSARAHLVLENPWPLSQPIACRGRLGLWTPPAEVLAWIEHDLGAST